MKKQKGRLLVTGAMLATFLVSIFTLSLSGRISRAASISELRNQAASLQAEIDSSHEKAEELEKQGDSLKSAVQGFDLRINQANKEIDLIKVKISQLEAELKKAEADLVYQKELLEASMKTLYKRGGASSVELLVASDSFSEFIDEQEYLERVKAGIQDSAEKIVALKKEIEKKKLDQQELLKKQEAVKRSLAAARQERAQLLAQTQGQEARYRNHIEALQEKRAAVEAELTRRLLAGNYVSLGRVNAGQMIGRVGMTGFTFGPHLHFELRDSGANPINPMSGGGMAYGLTWPVPSSHHVSQYFGCGAPYGWYVRKCGNGTSLHSGLDIAAPIGTPIVAAASGTIIHRSDDGDGYGIKVIIRHDNGMFSYYAHLNP